MRKTLGFLAAAALICVLAGSAFAGGWQDAYIAFAEQGGYLQYIRAANPEFTEMVYERDTKYDTFSLADMNRDGIPELLVRIDYGYEQIDVFTWEDGRVAWKGTMGGDNFFQAVISYEKAGLPGALYTLSGGPAMAIDEYKLVKAGVVKRSMGMTQVDSEGMETVGITMYEQDDTLERLVYGTAIGSDDQAVYPEWLFLDDLKNRGGWAELFGQV